MFCKKFMFYSELFNFGFLILKTHKLYVACYTRVDLKNKLMEASLRFFQIIKKIKFSNLFPVFNYLLGNISSIKNKNSFYSSFI